VVRPPVGARHWRSELNAAFLVCGQFVGRAGLCVKISLNTTQVLIERFSPGSERTLSSNDSRCLTARDGSIRRIDRNKNHTSFHSTPQLRTLTRRPAKATSLLRVAPTDKQSDTAADWQQWLYIRLVAACPGSRPALTPRGPSNRKYKDSSSSPAENRARLMRVTCSLTRGSDAPRRSQPRFGNDDTSKLARLRAVWPATAPSAQALVEPLHRTRCQYTQSSSDWAWTHECRYVFSVRPLKHRRGAGLRACRIRRSTHQKHAVFTAHRSAISR